MRKLNVLISGSTGYMGIQLIKLLKKHKNVKIKYLCGNSSVGKKISHFDKSLNSKNLPSIVKFKKFFLKNVDLVFTALPNGEAQKLSNYLLPGNKLIDLAADFRLTNYNNYKKWYKKRHKAKNNISKSLYSIPELNKYDLKKFKIIACPGCYPTSVLLPLIPLIKKKLILLKNIVVDSKSGYSGAGRGIHKKHKDKNLYNSLSVYGVGFHRHNSEIEQEISKICNKNYEISFTPHLTPMFRGIMSTIYLNLPKGITSKKIFIYLKKFYKNKKFIKFAKFNKPISTNDVINTNNCLISICKSKYKDKIIILSTIDNLIKGGSGQGIQNMNLIYNFPESRGLS